MGKQKVKSKMADLNRNTTVITLGVYRINSKRKIFQTSFKKYIIICYFKEIYLQTRTQRQKTNYLKIKRKFVS